MTTEIPSVRQEPQLRRALSTLDSYTLGFGAMIGFGWVVLTGGWLEAAGTLGAVVALVSGGLIMVVVGLVYAELTSVMPKAGGEHHYMMRGLGARWAFFGSWGVTGGYIAIVAFEAVALPRTIGYIFPDIDHGYLWSVFGSDVYLVWALIGSVSALFITAINYVGTKAAGLTQTFVVLFLALVGALLTFGSGMNGSVGNMEPFFTGTAGLFTVLIVAPFLGEGALGWLVDSGSPSIVLTYFMVCVVFLVLRRKEPATERPFSTGAGRLGFGVGVLGLVLTLGLLSLYIPGMPASIHPISHLIFGGWWLLGLVFLLRIPRGIHGGADAEARLLGALERRRSG